MKWTIFTTCKPFEGIIGTNQRSAIKSWTLLEPRPDILLIGDEPGTADLARDLGIMHVGSVTRNRWGTPLVPGLFWVAITSGGPGDVLCYVNSDILLLPSFTKAVAAADDLFETFLLTGPRWDLQVDDPINFDEDWVKALTTALKQRGRRHKPTGQDYLVFTRLTFHPSYFPPLAIGHNGWDSWIIWEALRQKTPVIDASQAITAIHQDHGPAVTNSEQHKMNRAIVDYDRMGRAYIWEATYRMLTGRRYQVRPAPDVINFWAEDVGWK